MSKLKGIYVVFLASLVAGQLMSLRFSSGAAIYTHDVCILLSLLGTAVALRRRRISPVTPILRLPIVMFVLAAVVSLLMQVPVFGAGDIVVSSLYLLRWMVYAGMYWMVLQRLVPSSFWEYGLYLLGFGLAALGIVQFVLYPSLRNLEYLGWDPHYYRVFTTLLDPNFAGIVFVLALILGVFLWKKHRSDMILGSLFVILAALVLTFSRSSMLALASVVAVYGLRSRHKRKVFLLLIAGIIAFVFVPKPGGDTLRVFRSDSTISRIENWQYGLELFYESPVFGHGFNTLRLLDTSIQSENGYFSHGASGIDNGFIMILATTGIVGMMAFLHIIYRVYRMAFSSQKVRYERDVLVYSAIAVGVHSLFLPSFLYPWVMLWMWALVGLVERR